MGKNIGYHTRSMTGEKLSGGSFGGQIDMETVNRLTRNYSVRIKESGTAVFVNSNGVDVYLYLTVDPSTTEKGKAARSEWYEREKVERAAREKLRREQEARLSELLDGMDTEEAIRRLSGK